MVLYLSTLRTSGKRLRHQTADSRLAVALHILFLYNDDGSQFYITKPHKMTCGSVSVQSDRLIQVKIQNKDKHRTVIYRVAAAA